MPLHFTPLPLMINNFKNHIIEYSAEDSDYSFLLFLEKSLAIIPIIREIIKMNNRNIRNISEIKKIAHFD